MVFRAEMMFDVASDLLVIRLLSDVCICSDESERWRKHLRRHSRRHSRRNL
jgi:hypothetical protein